MADLAFVAVIVAFFLLAAALVAGCDRIVRADRDHRTLADSLPADPPEEVTA